MTPLSSDELERYGRHVILPQVGVAGQQRLKDSSVVVVGAGGLGSPVLLYLAAAGVGRIGVVDSDRVEVTNLQRQVLFGTASVGSPKTDAARERLRDLNPNIAIEAHTVRISAATAMDLIGPYDVIVDGSDNFPTRYLVNDAAVLLGKPNVYGSISQFEGQASLFFATLGPCYRCLYPAPPPPGLVRSCEEAGVFGVLPGIIGAIQAAETIKWITGIGEPLVGRLLLFDALRLSFREIRVPKSASCPICGEAPTVRGLFDIDDACAVPATGRERAVTTIPPREAEALRTKATVRLIDVREPHEWRAGHIEGAEHVPLGALAGRVKELPRDEPIVVYCRTGGRSADAALALQESGFTSVRSLAGGLERWRSEGLAITRE